MGKKEVIKGILQTDLILSIELKNEQIDELYIALSNLLDRTIGFINIHKINNEDKEILTELKNLLGNTINTLDNE